MDRSVPRYSTGFLRLVLAVGLLALAAGPGFAAHGGDHFLLRDGVVVDAARGVAYVMRPAGGIDAIDLANGRALWTTEAAARPLTMVEGKLVAQAEGAPGAGLRIVSLDPEARGALVQSAEVALPEGVRGAVDDGWRTKLQVSATAAAGGTLIAWKSTELLSQAALPGPFEGQAPGFDKSAVPRSPSPLRELEGVARVDFQAGKVFAVPAKAGAADRIVLREVPTKERIAAEGREFLSADGRHVLVSTFLDGDATPTASYRWTLYERATGNRLGSFDHSASAAPFLVVGKHVVFEVQGSLRATGGADEPWENRSLELRAIDLLSGTPVWKAEVRDTSFHGEIPP